jgi:hypothetical protein
MLSINIRHNQSHIKQIIDKPHTASIVFLHWVYMNKLSMELVQRDVRYPSAHGASSIQTRWRMESVGCAVEAQSKGRGR